jgi:allantoin racemase
MLHIASLVGDRFGGMVYHEKLLALMQAIVRRYGMDHKMVGWQVSGFDLPDIAENAERMKENFVARAREMIERDRCDVLLVLGITQCPVHMKPQWLQEQLGVPVVEGIGAPIRIASMLASLGLPHSRQRWPKSQSFQD